MAGREVKLKVRVDDAEVKGAEASLNRLKKAADQPSDRNSFGGRRYSQADFEEAARKQKEFLERDMPRATKEAERGIKAVESASAGATRGMNGMAASGMSAARVFGIVGIAAVAAAAVFYKVTRAIIDTAKSFADYAIELGNVSEATGLAVSTVAALRVEAEAQGRSFGVFESGVQKFRKTIGEAAAGVDDARKKLIGLGVDGRIAINDLDGALRSALTAIVSAPNEFERIRLSIAAFGDEGPKLLPFFKEFGGDIDRLITKTEQLGMSLSGPQVRAAREFNRAYEEIKNQFKAVGYEAGSVFMPVVRDVLREFSDWFNRNKADVRSWADYIVSAWKQAIDSLRKEITDLRNLYDQTLGEAAQRRILSNFQPMATDADLRRALGHAPKMYNPLPVQPQSWGIDQPGIAPSGPDPAAVAAMQAAAEKLRQERERAAQQELAARIQLYERSATALGKTYDDAFKQITERAKETLDIGQYEAAWQTLRQWYGEEINKLAPEWERLVEQRIASEKKSAAEIELVRRDLADKQQAMSQRTITNEESFANTIRDIRKRLSADYIKILETEMRRKDDLAGASARTRVAQLERDASLEIITERQKVDAINTLELSVLTDRRQRLTEHLERVKGNADIETDIQHRIALLDEEITQQKITNGNRILELETKKQELLNRLRESFESYRDALLDETTVLQRGGRALSNYERVLRDMQRSYKGLTPEQKEFLLNQALINDALEEMNRQYQELKGFFKESFRSLLDGDVKGLFGRWADRIKDGFAEKLSEIFATNLLGFNPAETNNPVARPIVKTLDRSNDLLKRIEANTRMGGGGAGAGPASGGIGGLLQSIFRGTGGDGGSHGRDPDRGYSAPGHGSHGSPLGDLMGMLGSGGGGEGSGGRGIGGLWGNLKNVFSTGEGGIFAPRGGSKAAGIMGGIGDLAAIAGGLIGGRFGNVLSMAGTGASIGAMFGPWGAAIGAGIGALIGLFTGGGQRKRDQQTLMQATTDAQRAIREQFDKLIEDVRFGRTDPTTAVTQGTSIGQNIRDQYMQMANGLKDKRTRRKAIADVSQIDSLIAQKMTELRAVAERATASADRMKRILPEFAGGSYIADFFRPNGLIPGIFDSKDSLLAMLSHGEMVLNPTQQTRVRALAGFDVFAGAGIPNYPNASAKSSYAEGGIASRGLALSAMSPTITVAPTIVIEGVAMDDRIEGYMESDSGMRTQVRVVKKLKAKGDL